MTKTILRFVIVILLAIPVAALFTAEAMIFILMGLDFDNQTVPLIQVQIAVAVVFLASYVGLIYWAAWEVASVRRAISRTCLAFSTLTLLLPIALFVWGITSPPDVPGAIFGKWVVLIVFSIFGVIIGIVGLVLGEVVAPSGAPERSPKRLFRETIETVRRIGMPRIALALTLLVLGVAVLRVGSTSGFWSEKYTSIATNHEHTCGIRTDGTAHCWGYRRLDAIPPPDERFVAIAPGVGNACGLREDGSLLCWGNIRYSNGVELPANPGIETSRGPFAQITSGVSHYCGLRTDGTAECWGDDPYGYGTTSPPLLESVSRRLALVEAILVEYVQTAPASAGVR